MGPDLSTDEELTEIYRRQVDAVYRVCYAFMKNPADTEDLVQETFLKLLTSGRRFDSQDHERAWLIVTASNACKDALKHAGGPRSLPGPGPALRGGRGAQRRPRPAGPVQGRGVPPLL